MGAVLERRLWPFVVFAVVAAALKGGAHPTAAGATKVAVRAGAHAGVGLDLLDLGNLLDHSGLDRLNRHRGNPAAGTRAPELDGDHTLLAVEMLDGRRAAVHLNLREVPPQEVGDALAQFVFAGLALRAHEQ